MTDEEKKAIEILKLRLENASLYVRGNNEVFYNALGIVLKLIEKQQKEIEELKEKNEYLPNWVSKKYVSKDKIKAKKEELQNKSGGNVFHIQQTINAEIRLLQSLLEKE